MKKTIDIYGTALRNGSRYTMLPTGLYCNEGLRKAERGDRVRLHQRLQYSGFIFEKFEHLQKQTLSAGLGSNKHSQIAQFEVCLTNWTKILNGNPFFLRHIHIRILEGLPPDFMPSDEFMQKYY